MRIILIVTTLLATLVGCGDAGKQKYFKRGDIERGVRVEIMLVGGGSATLVCPKFPSEPWGTHGRECYLERYDYRLEGK